MAGFLSFIFSRRAARFFIRAGANAYATGGSPTYAERDKARRAKERWRREVASQQWLADLPPRPSGGAPWRPAPRTSAAQRAFDEDLNKRIDDRVRREMAQGCYDGEVSANQGRAPTATTRSRAAIKSNGGLRGGATRMWRK